MNEQLEKLTILGTDATQATISHYTHWFQVSAITWTGVGISCGLGAIWAWKHREKLEFGKEISIALLVISILTIGCNVATLFSPRAYAIHQLINDIRQ